MRLRNQKIQILEIMNEFKKRMDVLESQKFGSDQWIREYKSLNSLLESEFKLIEAIEKEIQRDRVYQNQKRILAKEWKLYFDYFRFPEDFLEMSGIESKSENMNDLIEILLDHFDFEEGLQKIRIYINKKFHTLSARNSHSEIFRMIDSKTKNIISSGSALSLEEFKKFSKWKKKKWKLIQAQIEEVQNEQKKILQVLKQSSYFLIFPDDLRNFLKEEMENPPTHLNEISSILIQYLDSKEIMEIVFKLKSERILYLPEYSDQWIWEEFMNIKKYPDNDSILKVIDNVYSPGKGSLKLSREKLIEKILLRVKIAKGNKIKTAG